MALKFANTKGAAIKGAEAYTYKDGENTIRIFGDVLPRYLYWIKGKNNKDIPLECLSFDREKEKFTNAEKDWVKEFFPELKCGWAYCVMGYSLADKKPVVINLKKKLFEQILSAAEDLGDPTDPDTGWDIVFKRAKTGAQAFNVEYTLSVLRCKARSLSEEERAMISTAKTVDESVPRLTAEDQKNFLDSLKSDSDSTSEVPPEVKEEVDDIPM